MLGDVPAQKFERGLDTILAHLVARGRTIAMFELPLLPNKIAYGQVQRRLSAKYSILLIPKHCFASVISGTSATSDGLHLSNIGARRMALLVARVLAPVLTKQKPR
jgi:lysophospholipase L1-like esterase